MIEITLESIGNGALAEKFQDAMAQVVQNTCDPNTDATKKRKLKVELVFTPDKNDRAKCSMESKVEATLAPTKPLISTVLMGLDTDTGEIAAVEHAPVQGELFPPKTAKKPEAHEGRVVSISAR